MTSGGNNFNDFPDNQQTKFSRIYLLIPDFFLPLNSYQASNFAPPSPQDGRPDRHKGQSGKWTCLYVRLSFRWSMTQKSREPMGPRSLHPHFLRKSKGVPQGARPLLVPPTKRSTPGDRAFPVEAARAWNALPARGRSEPSFRIFCRQLKTHLFCVSFQEQTKWILLFWSDVSRTIFSAFYTVFLYFCTRTVVLQQLHATVPL